MRTCAADAKGRLPVLSVGHAIQIRRQLRTQSAGDEDQLVVRGELAQPIKGAAVNQRHVLAAAAARADHESQSVVVVMRERFE